MKKIIFLYIITITMILLLGCPFNHEIQKESENETSSSDENNNSSPEDPVISDLNIDAPLTTIKICFIHHSVGSHWIQSGLGVELNNNNYFVSETDYGWDAEADDNLGNRTNTNNWPQWFNDTKMPYVYANSHHEHHSNAISDPGGENEIIMFKSCYPNSEVDSSIEDEKTIYNGLLTYFAAHTNKMFILIIPPPEIEISSDELTRELSSWLVDRNTGWLSTYEHNNVYAFNYYNVLTDPNNHHWVNNNREENIVSINPIDPDNPNELYYPMSPGNDHPNNEGHQKATSEFINLLNGWYHLWQD